MVRPVLAALLVFATGTVVAADAPDAKALLDAERAAMKSFAIFDGTWRGPATVIGADGSKRAITQTERVGSLLDGTIKVIEGRGYTADGTLGFNAFGVISFDPRQQAHRFHSYAQGYAGDFAMEARPDGYVWTIPAGPATIRYTATLADGTWTEIGERVVEGKPPTRIFEMHLKRVGDTDWPLSGAMTPQ